jgi:phage gp46-like protein
MTDVLLRHTPDGGEITIEAGLVLMSEGLESAAYLSLFGGNRDDGADKSGERLQWWGNLDEPVPERTYRSETQYLMRSIPSVPSNLRRFEQAAARDLDWMITTGLARRVDVQASIPGRDRVRLDITIVTLAEQIQLSFGQRTGDSGPVVLD